MLLILPVFPWQFIGRYVLYNILCEQRHGWLYNIMNEGNLQTITTNSTWDFCKTSYIFFLKSFRLLSSHCIRTQQKSYKWHWNNIHLTTIMKKQGWNLDWLTDNGCNDYSNHHNKNYPHLTEWNKNNTLNYGNQTCIL